MLAFSYWSIVYAFVGAAAGTVDPLPPLALGLGLAPFVFVTLAFLSRHEGAPGAVLRAMLWAPLVGVSTFVLAREVVTALVAGFGAGGGVSLRAEPIHKGWWRPAAILTVAIYTFVLVRTVPPMAVFGAPFFPLFALGAADLLAERRQQNRG